MELTMKPKELYETLLVAAQNRRPILIKGAPGIGKTDICRQVAETLGMDYIPVIPCLMDPTDPKGVIGKTNGHYEWMLVGDARRIVEATKPTLVLIDDVIQAPPSIQAAIMQWPLLRMIGEHKIPDCVTIFAATNRRKDKAGGMGVIEPFKSRFDTIIELVPDALQWIEWAYAHDMPPVWIAYIYFIPEAIYDNIATLDLVNSARPRTVANAGKLYKIGLDSIKIVAGAIGEGRAKEFKAFEKTFLDLPNITDCLVNPDTAKVPDEISAKCAICTALAERVTKQNFANVSKYGQRLGNEHESFLMTCCTLKWPDLKLESTKPYTDWALRREQRKAV